MTFLWHQRANYPLSKGISTYQEFREVTWSAPASHRGRGLSQGRRRTGALSLVILTSADTTELRAIRLLQVTCGHMKGATTPRTFTMNARP